MVRIKRIARGKEWARKDDDHDHQRRRRRRRRIGTKGTGCGKPREVTALSTAGQYGALLVTVTVHLHSDLLNNAGIILVEGKRRRRRRRRWTYLESPRPSTRRTSPGVSRRVWLACLPTRSLERILRTNFARWILEN